MEQETSKKIFPHPFAYIPYYAFAIVFVLSAFLTGPIGFAAGAFIAGIAEAARRVEYFELRREGVARGFSFFSRGETLARYERIQDISVTQSVWDRIFGIGTVTVNTAGSSKPEIVFHGVKNPDALKKRILERMERA